MPKAAPCGYRRKRGYGRRPERGHSARKGTTGGTEHRCSHLVATHPRCHARQGANRPVFKDDGTQNSSSTHGLATQVSRFRRLSCHTAFNGKLNMKILLPILRTLLRMTDKLRTWRRPYGQLTLSSFKQFEPPPCHLR